MATEVEICRLALYLIGAESIISIEPPDDNDRARLCAIFYPNSRDATLRSHDWNFVIRRRTLNLDTVSPDNGYDYQYILPTDPYCLRVIQLNDDDTLNWVIESRRILTNETEAIIKYLAKITDPIYFDSLFVEALAARLAMDLSMPITKSKSMLEAMEKLYEYKLTEARGVNERERGNVPYPISPYILVR